MALTANRNVDRFVDQELRLFPVAASTKVYKGAFVGLKTSGYVRGLTAGDPVVGIAYEEVDNSAGANGALSVRVYTQGDFSLALAGATVADLGRPVFASADDALTLAGEGNSYVGVVESVPQSGVIILRLDAGRNKVRSLVHAVEDLSAGADIAERAIFAFSKDGWIVGARVVNQATAAAGINDANTCVVLLKLGSNTVVSGAFNTGNPFPAANAAASLGAITTSQARVGDVLKLAVTNGATADPGPFLVEVDVV